LDGVAKVATDGLIIKTNIEYRKNIKSKNKMMYDLWIVMPPEYCAIKPKPTIKGAILMTFADLEKWARKNPDTARQCDIRQVGKAHEISVLTEDEFGLESYKNG
jgi:hypothetical protein